MKKFFFDHKRVLFPFYKERHNFLYEKKWFRLIIVFYIVAFIFSPFRLFFSWVNSNSGWCYDSLPLFYGDYSEFNKQLDHCSELARSAWGPGIGVALVGTLILHYLIQLIFFKIIVDFVILGGKEKYNKQL